MVNQQQEIIKQVWMNKHTGQKMVTIPKKSDIDNGDFVKIKKVIMK